MRDAGCVMVFNDEGRGYGMEADWLPHRGLNLIECVNLWTRSFILGNGRGYSSSKSVGSFAKTS